MARAPIVLLVIALLFVGCSNTHGGTKHREWAIDLLEANFICERTDEGIEATWMDTTSSSVSLRVHTMKDNVPCEAIVGGKYRVSGQEIHVELINGIVPNCTSSNERCLMDTQMTLAEPAVDPSKDVSLTVMFKGGQSFTTTLPARS